MNILYVQRSPRPDLVPFGSSGIIRNNLLAASKEKPQIKTIELKGHCDKLRVVVRRDAAVNGHPRYLQQGDVAILSPRGQSRMQ